MSCRSMGMHPARRPGAAARTPRASGCRRATPATPRRVLGRVPAEVHGGRQTSGQDRARKGHLGVDPLVLQHRQPTAAGIGCEDPVTAVAGQPSGRGHGVHAHARQPACGHRPDGVRIVDEPGVDTTEHRNGHRRQVAECRHVLASGRVDIAQELVEVVRSRVGVRRHHHVGPPAAQRPTVRTCQPTRLPDVEAAHPSTVAGYCGPSRPARPRAGAVP